MTDHAATAQDARALVYLARRLRDVTYGCKQWDEGGTWAVFRDELIGQNLALSIERVLCHATDPEAKTPGAIRRPFTPPKPTEQPKRGGPPKAHTAEECPKHPGQWATGCATCATEDIRAAYDDAPPSPDLPNVADVAPNLAKRLAARTEDA
jgi:hypothetical protein